MEVPNNSHRTRFWKTEVEAQDQVASCCFPSLDLGTYLGKSQVYNGLEIHSPKKDVQLPYKPSHFKNAECESCWPPGKCLMGT